LDSLLQKFEKLFQDCYLQADLKLEDMSTASECAVHACRDVLKIALNDQTNKPGIGVFQTNQPTFHASNISTVIEDNKVPTFYSQEPSLTLCTEPKPCQKYVIASTAEFRPSTFQQEPYCTFSFGNQYARVASISRESSSANIEINHTTSIFARHDIPRAQRSYNTPVQSDGAHTRDQRANEQTLTFDNVVPHIGVSNFELQTHPFRDYNPLSQGTEVSSSASYYDSRYHAPVVHSSTGFEARNEPITESVERDQNDDHNFFLDGS
jgi:hypothetical protein